ncbi:MAG: hypothetical protein ABH954_01440 [Candidatus Omnitrophota bacterium]
MAKFIFRTNNDFVRTFVILIVVLCILFGAATISSAYTPTKWDFFKFRLDNIIGPPLQFCIEIIATVEAVWNLGAIRHSEFRYVVDHNGYVSDGLPWGSNFTQLDINPNRSPRRKWDYRVVASEAHFLAEARRRHGQYRNKEASLTDGGQWGGYYPYWLYRWIKKWFGG